MDRRRHEDRPHPDRRQRRHAPGNRNGRGEIELYGNAGDWAGAEIRGGRIHIHGHAGHLVGAAYRGSRAGIRGGAIFVAGNAGNEIGSTMRRGLIAIGGTSGDFAGVSLIAGSVFLFGQPGIRLGAGMKRGSIGLFNGAPPLLPTFRLDCIYQPVIVNIYLKQLQSWGFAVPEGSIGGFYQRYSGDLVGLGKGEILQWRKEAQV